MKRIRLTNLALLALCSSAVAGEDLLTGGWRGERKAFADKGVEFSAAYTGEVFGNATGGITRGVVFNGLFELGLDLDLKKLTGWSGAHFHVGTLDTHGKSGTHQLVGDLGTFSNIDAYDSFRLYELWLEQNFFDDAISLCAGQLDIDEDFASTALGSLFISSDFGNSAAFSTSFPEPTFSVLALGARLRIQPFPGVSATFAAYDGNPATALSNPSPRAGASRDFNRHGTDWSLRADEGALLAAQIAYAFNQPKTATSSDDANGKGGRAKAIVETQKLGGIYQAGVVHHTGTFSKTSDTQLTSLGSFLAPPRARSEHGDTVFFFVADQDLWREPGSIGDGLAVFGRATFAQSDRDLLSRAYEGGLVYRGLLQKEAADRLGLGFAVLDISKHVSDATRAANRRDQSYAATPDFEATIELTYQFQLNAWCSVQPDLQWIIHPGGSRELDDALVIGVRTSVAF